MNRSNFGKFTLIGNILSIDMFDNFFSRK